MGVVPLGRWFLNPASREERRLDRIEHDADLAQNHSVGKAQNAITLTAKILIALGVVSFTVGKAMLLTIDFDDEAPRKAAKIRNVGADRDLAPEM